jgi:protein CpxP
MRALILTMAILIGVMTSGYSQNKEGKQKRTVEERAKIRTDAMAKKMNLSADQKAKVYELNLDKVKQMEKLRTENAKERKERFEKQKEMSADNDKKLERILNADQLKIYQDMKANSRQRMKQNHPHSRDGKMNRIKR